MSRTLALKTIWAVATGAMLAASAGDAIAQDNVDLIKKALGGVFQRLHNRSNERNQKTAATQVADNPKPKEPAPKVPPPKLLRNVPPDIVGFQLTMTPAQAMAALKASRIYAPSSIKKYRATLQYSDATGGHPLPGSEFLKEMDAHDTRGSDSLTLRFSPVAGHERVVAISRGRVLSVGSSSNVTYDSLMQGLREKYGPPTAKDPSTPDTFYWVFDASGKATTTRPKAQLGMCALWLPDVDSPDANLGHADNFVLGQFRTNGYSGLTDCGDAVMEVRFLRATRALISQYSESIVDFRAIRAAQAKVRARIKAAETKANAKALSNARKPVL